MLPSGEKRTLSYDRKLRQRDRRGFAPHPTRVLNTLARVWGAQPQRFPLLDHRIAT